MTSIQADVFIVGGGPAGLAAAIAAREAGFSVALADCARPPIDKACGEGIMPDGLAALRGLGVELPEEAGYRFRGIKFQSGERAVDSYFVNGSGVGLRRTDLHQVLLDHAMALGVKMHWGARVAGTPDGNLRVNGDAVRSDWLVAADGHNSAIRKWAGLDDGRTTRRRFGFRRHFKVAPWSEYVEIYWSDSAQMYITPVAADTVCVALISSDQQLRFHEGLQQFPEVERHLGAAVAVTNEQGGLSATQRFRSVYKGNVALLGDASGSVDAITGDGLSLAFQQAVALAAAMKAGDLAAYQREHRRIERLPRFMADFMLLMDGRPRLRDRVFAALTAEPQLFRQMLALHTGAVAPLQFGVSNAAAFGWRMLTA